MNFDITQSTRTVILAPAAAQSVTNTTPAVDVTKFYGVASLAIDAGSFTAGATIAVNLQDAATLGGTYANVPGTTVFLTEASAGLSQNIGVNTDALRGFVRAVITLGGPTPTVNASVRFSGYSFP